MSLTGKTAVVTGSNSGIGLGVAQTLAERGCKVVLNSYTNSDEDHALAAKLADQFGTEVIYLQADLAKADQARGLITEAAEKLGSVDILVNNAGVTRDNLLMRMSEEEWDTVINTNLKGAFNFTKALTRPFIKQRSGRIINIASVIGLIGNAGQSNYAASKAALIGFTKSVAKELAPRGITANAIAPGFIETDMTAALDDKVRESIIGNVPLGRFGSPDDIAHAAVFLAMEPSGYITGQVLTVDGGMVM